MISTASPMRLEMGALRLNSSSMACILVGVGEIAPQANLTVRFSGFKGLAHSAATFAILNSVLEVCFKKILFEFAGGAFR